MPSHVRIGIIRVQFARSKKKWLKNWLQKNQPIINLKTTNQNAKKIFQISGLDTFRNL